MKKIFTSIILFALLLLNSISIAQTTHPVELGFNVGASWLKSDVKMKKLGGAGGFTLGQMYAQNDKNALDWGWRFRYLNAIAYGQDSKKSTGIANNPILNGAYDTAYNYNSNGGFVYQNYKTTINELSLELVIGANQMRNKTKVYPYIFGGLGIIQAVTKTNQLDAKNKRYNYMAVDSNGTANGSQITSSLNKMYDGTYETAAEGSETPLWKFMPSLGVGLGYQFTPGFSMGVEHKMTWALHDGLDGQQWANDNTLSPTKDKYHYSSVWLKFSFGRGTHPTSTNTNVNTNTNNVNTNTNTNIITTAGDKPTVVITNPSVNSYTSTSQSYTVRATIKNVSSKNDIGLVYNGVSNTNFTYDATSQTFAFPLMLLNGSNSFMITATNVNGNTTSNAIVFFESPIVVTPPLPAPIIKITSPTTNPYSTTMNNATVLATVLNVAAQSQISVTINGVATGSFLYNATSHILNVNSNLNQGANVFVISATNVSGSDSKSITVIYNIANVTPPPLITFINPAVNPFTSTVSSLPINAIVQNITSVGQISVTSNGAPVPTSLLGFNPSTGQLSFNSNLIVGANTVNISATNVAGADSKAITIIYNQPLVVTPAPVVTITSPTVNPLTTFSNVATVKAIVLNVSSPSQIAVSVNGVNTSAFSYNMASKQLLLTINLIVGANVIIVSASNTSGSDSKSTTIIYSQPIATPAPIVTITSPTGNPFNTSSNVVAISATVLNVLSASQIAVSLNGVNANAFTYSFATKQFNFNANLIAGANIVTISATTTSGSDAKSETIIYSQQVATPSPSITITAPNINPFNTTSNIAAIAATVLNVTSASQITVSINSVSTNIFMYNMATKQLTLSPTLIVGANIVTISANTTSGSDSKSITIIYTPVVVATPAPIVTITSPAINPFNTSTTTSTINATVLNVASSSQINVSINGGTVPFNYNLATKQLSLTSTLIVGANIVTISASTTSGSDSKSTTIIYTAPVVIPAPIVTFTKPSPLGGGSSTAVFGVEATVLNVLSNTAITVKVNGVNITAFTYNASTKQVKFNANLVVGANIVIISATNASGSDSKSVTITYRPSLNSLNPDSVNTPVNPGNPNIHNNTVIPKGTSTGTTEGFPTVTFGLSNPFIATTAIVPVTAVVGGVIMQSDIVVKINGVLVPFVYAIKTKIISFDANVNVGTNTITVTATNTVGVITGTLMITRP